jgi:aspartate ammonia-lyase
MPGKVNPVLLEAVMQAGMKVAANDMLVTAACSRSSLQINEFMPLLAASLLESLDLLTRADAALAAHVAALSADAAVCRSYLEKSPMIVTALLPYVGYEKAAALLEEHQASGTGTLLAFLTARLGKQLVEEAFSPQRLTSLGHTEGPA